MQPHPTPHTARQDAHQAPQEPSPVTPGDEASPRRAPTARFVQTFRCTALLFWGVVVPPIFLYAAAEYGPVDDVWQSGQYGDYALLLYRWPSLLLHYPVLLFSAVAIARLAWSPEAHRSKPWAIVGVVTGAALWVELTAVWAPCVARELSGPPAVVTLLLLSPIAGATALLPWLLLARLHRRPSSIEVSVYALLAAIFLVLAIATRLELPALYFFACLIWSAPLAAMVYLWASWECLSSFANERYRLSLKALMALLAWVSLHLASWRLAVNSMLAQYASTPTEQPDNCFVATAAAQGRRWLVRGERVRLADGQTRQITRQLQRLKAAELVLRATAPRAHQALRAFYNRVGPPLARAIGRPVLAELTYAALKPAEWLARLIVLPAAGVRAEQVRRLYRFHSVRAGASRISD